MSTVSWLYRLPPEETAVWGVMPQALAVVGRAGIVTVPSFVISATALQELYLQPKLKKAIEGALKDHDTRRSEHLAGIAKEVRASLRATKFEPTLKKEVAAHLDELEHYLLLKKGSGLRLNLIWCEGQAPIHHTATVKTWEEFERALLDLLALHFTVPEFNHRLKKQGVVMPAPAPVLVQAHPEAVASGIGQMYDPQHHDSHTLYLTAHHHEHVRERASDTDVYRYDRTTLLPLSRSHGKHRWAEKRDGRHTKPEHGAHAILSETEQHYLARLIRRAQGAFGQAMRFHWVKIQDQFFIAEAYVLPEGHTQQSTTGEEEPEGPLPLAFGHSLNPGIAAGTIRFIEKAADAEALQPGDIAVVPHLRISDRDRFHSVRALICEVGNPASPEAAIAVSLGVPALGGLPHIRQILTDGQLVTIDADHGVVYAGNQSIDHTVQPALPGKPPVTATHVSLIVADPLHVTKELLTGTEGVGLFRGEFLLEMAGVHPKHILERKKEGEYGEILEDVVEQAARAAHPYHVRYQLHDIHPQKSSLHHRHEPNPKLGYRGAHRLLKEPELVEVELKALHRLQKKGVSTIELVLPMVRSTKEAEHMINLVQSLWPGDGGLPRIWLRCETPALAISSESLCKLPIHGIYLDVPALAQFMSGLDGHNYQTEHHLDQADSAMLDAVHYAVGTCRAHGVRSVLIAEEDELHAEVIAEAVAVGLTEVAVSRSEVEEVRGLLASIERRLLVDHVLEEGMPD